MQTDAIHRITTAESVAIPIDVFEKLYLNPPRNVAGDLRKRFANPSPLALVGFLMSTTPVTSQLMQWGGSGGGGNASIGMLYSFGGLLQVVAAVLELFLGNTFAFVVFGTFSAFWMSLAATMQPFYNAQHAFLDGSLGFDPSEGMMEFNASIALFFVFFGILVAMFAFFATKTNAIFVVVFVLLSIGVWVLSAAYWVQSKEGLSAKAVGLQKVLNVQTAGALIFTVCVLGWYLLAAVMLADLGFAQSLPVGDLSKRFNRRTSDLGQLEVSLLQSQSIPCQGRYLHGKRRAARMMTIQLGKLQAEGSGSQPPDFLLSTPHLLPDPAKLHHVIHLISNSLAHYIGD